MSSQISESSCFVRDSRREGESVGGDRISESPKCHCSAWATIQTSLTEGNPGKCFFGCPYFGGTPVSTVNLIMGWMLGL